jgi:hypothetical protein
VGTKRARLDPRDRLADVGVGVVERLERERRTNAALARDRGLHLVVVEREHPAIGVMDEDDLLGAEEALRDDEGSDGVVGDDATRIADHVRVALLETEDPRRVETGIHAGEHRDLRGRRHREVTLAERSCVRLVVGEQVIGD